MISRAKDRRMCRHCVTPESSRFPLDSEGTCKLCRTPASLEHIIAKGSTEELQRIVDRTKAQGLHRPFDCVVAWSGGRDSTFMIHELVRRFGLRCAAVFGTTPFTPPEIVENVHSISKTLGVKLIEVQSLSNHLKLAGYCLKEYIASHKPILINLACASCKFINREIFREADRLGVRTIFYGGNRFEYFPSGPASIDLEARDRYTFYNMIRDNVSRLGKGFATLLHSPALLRHIFTFFGGSILYVNQYSIFLRMRYPSIERLDYYHFADWEEESVSAVLRDLHWRLPPGCTTTWRADCTFEAVKNAAFKSQLGFSYAEAMFSNLIRAGKMTRESALARLEKEPISEKRLTSALSNCGVSVQAFDTATTS